MTHLIRLVSILLFAFVSSGWAQMVVRNEHDCPPGTTCIMGVPGTELDAQNCRARLTKALARARKYVPNHLQGIGIVNAVYDPCLDDGECIARRRLAQIIEEKALAAEIDTLLQECP